ncbi:MAG: Grx4 family monothiol glutaredoxin [Bdellovibrionota bacterium]
MSDQSVNERIEKEIGSSKVFLFMKGTPQEPMCGFSAQVVQILNGYGVEYKSFNVLEDWDVREGIKSYSNWPTIPQLYVNGKFVGGCDIAMELHRKGELKSALA